MHALSIHHNTCLSIVSHCGPTAHVGDMFCLAGRTTFERMTTYQDFKSIQLKECEDVLVVIKTHTKKKKQRQKHITVF